jgi:multidrug efflux pump subunit AcrA (membrane-fusion protein)
VLLWAGQYLAPWILSPSLQAKIIPSGRTKVIQPFETGVVRAINIQDGQSVKLGDVLLELDPTMAGAELGHLKADLMAARLEAARLRAAIAGNSDPTLDFKLASWEMLSTLPCSKLYRVKLNVSILIARSRQAAG